MHSNFSLFSVKNKVLVSKNLTLVSASKSKDKLKKIIKMKNCGNEYMSQGHRHIINKSHSKYFDRENVLFETSRLSKR